LQQHKTKSFTPTMEIKFHNLNSSHKPSTKRLVTTCDYIHFPWQLSSVDRNVTYSCWSLCSNWTSMDPLYTYSTIMPVQITFPGNHMKRTLAYILPSTITKAQNCLYKTNPNSCPNNFEICPTILSQAWPNL